MEIQRMQILWEWSKQEEEEEDSDEFAFLCEDCSLSPCVAIGTRSNYAMGMYGSQTPSRRSATMLRMRHMDYEQQIRL
jgi:hypothetical protein